MLFVIGRIRNVFRTKKKSENIINMFFITREKINYKQEKLIHIFNK